MSKYLLLIVFFVLCVAAPRLEAGDEKLALAMEWQRVDGTEGREVVAEVDITQVNGRGLWVAFQKEGDRSYPGVCLGGKFTPVEVPIEEMKALELVVQVNGKTRSATRRSVIFSDTRPLGSKMAAPDNVYHLLVLDGFVDAGSLRDSLDKDEVPAPDWAGPFWRTHRLAMNYAVQSDAKTIEYKKILDVQTRHSLPRLILVAEEWLDIPKEVMEEKKKSGGIFGGALDDLADDIAGEKKVVPTKIPIYSIDVLLDGLEAKGTYRNGFHAARSVWNDMLEGKIIYEASEGKRRVLTATIVFSQMQKNMSLRDSGNSAVTVDAHTTRLLDKCERLWPAVKDEIAAFLDENPDWKVIIPQKPVTFYEDDEPIYAMYAWLQVHPKSGRMVGVLPSGTRGGMSDEIPKAQKSLFKKGRDELVKKVGSSAVEGFFSQTAGMYVAAGGLLEGVTLTFCNPSIAALSHEEWKEFMAKHALDYCQKFLEENADQYDSYAAQLRFWQGAMVLIGEFGGKEGIRDCANRAIEGVGNKAVNDAKNYMDDKGEEGKKVLDEAMENYAPRVKRFVDGVNTVQKYYDKGADLATRAGEVVNDVRGRID